MCFEVYIIGHAPGRSAWLSNFNLDSATEPRFVRYKIGFTRNLDRRLYGLWFTEKTHDLYVMRSIPVYGMKNARAVEKRLHRLMAEHATDKAEWFAIPDAELPKLMEAMNTEHDNQKEAA